MEKQYHIEFPELMKGKKVMYVHGFASSAQSGTVALLRQLMPNAVVWQTIYRLYLMRLSSICTGDVKRRNPTSSSVRRLEA